MFKTTTYLKQHFLPCLFGLAAVAVSVLSLVPTTAYAQAAATLPPITEVSIFGRGAAVPEMPAVQSPPNVSPITGSVNGTAGTMRYSPLANGIGNASFSMNQVTIQGDPGTVTVIYTISHVGTGVDDAADAGVQTITFQMNTASGEVTVTGTDTGDGHILGATATLTVDGKPATGAAGANFTLTATGSMDDRLLKSCVMFASGMQICTDMFAVSKEEVTTPPTPEQTAQANQERDNLGTENYVAAIQLMAEQMSDVMVYQIPIIGMLLDAKHQLESSRIFGALAAQAHRDYQPSEQVCAFGTLARSTAPSKFRVEDNIALINLFLQKRETQNANLASAWGPNTDLMARLDKYKEVYCDRNDVGGEIGVSAICTAPAGSLRINKDIDWRRTVEAGMTLDIDFTNDATTPDEEDVMSLAKNLYASTVMTPIPEKAITPYGTTGTGSYRELQDSRMLSAVRSVERYSFASIVAAKSAGSGLNAAQLRQVLQNLGVAAADVTALVGENPSYFTQMDFISQKMFQDPNFYTGLYQNPANVARMKIVLQAIRLMADRDRFEESLRREMLISMILEMRLREAQGDVANTTAQTKANSGR